MKDCKADSTFERGVLTSIRVDTFQIAMLHAVVHELLHWVQRGPLNHYSRDAEEQTVVGHTQWLCSWIEEEESRLTSWRRLIAAHMKGSHAKPR